MSQLTDIKETGKRLYFTAIKFHSFRYKFIFVPLTFTI